MVGKIYLQPLEFNDRPLLDRVAKEVEEKFSFSVDVLPSHPLPEYSFNQGRGQYHSTGILRNLALNLPSDALRVLAITEADLYVPQLNFVFGEAAIDGKVCIISLYRLRPEFYGEPVDEELYIERAVKEAVHELGHTFGLRHSANPESVMHFSNTIWDTDKKTVEFPGEDGAQLRDSLNSLRTAA